MADRVACPGGSWTIVASATSLLTLQACPHQFQNRYRRHAFGIEVGGSCIVVPHCPAGYVHPNRRQADELVSPCVRSSFSSATVVGKNTLLISRSSCDSVAMTNPRAAVCCRYQQTLPMAEVCQPECRQLIRCFAIFLLPQPRCIHVVLVFSIAACANVQPAQLYQRLIGSAGIWVGLVGKEKGCQ